MHENEIGTLILDAAFQVHKELGPGLLESTYETCISYEASQMVEIKTVEKLNDVHLAQLLTYMKLSGCKLGYLINFNVKFLKEGIKRVVLGDLSS